MTCISVTGCVVLFTSRNFIENLSNYGMPLVRIHACTRAHTYANIIVQWIYIITDNSTRTFSITQSICFRISAIRPARYAYLFAIIDHLPSAWNFNPSYGRLVKFHEQAMLLVNCNIYYIFKFIFLNAIINLVSKSNGNTIIIKCTKVVILNQLQALSNISSSVRNNPKWFILLLDQVVSVSDNETCLFYL